jgi:hypothetical protein
MHLAMSLQFRGVLVPTPRRRLRLGVLSLPYQFRSFTAPATARQFYRVIEPNASPSWRSDRALPNKRCPNEGIPPLDSSRLDLVVNPANSPRGVAQPAQLAIGRFSQALDSFEARPNQQRFEFVAPQGRACNGGPSLPVHLFDDGFDVVTCC